MTPEEKEVLSECAYAIGLHLAVLERAKKKALFAELDDILDGMAITEDKLQRP